MRHALAVSALAFVLVSSREALAQQVTSYFDRGANVSVRDRPRPDYDAEGVHLGSFVLLPKITLAESYDDNIFARETNGPSDEITMITPEAQLVSNWTRNSLRLFAKGQYDGYAHYSSQSVFTYSLGAAGTYDLEPETALTASGTLQHLVEARTASGTPQTNRNPIEYDQQDLLLGVSHVFNHLRLQGHLDFDRLDYDDNRGFDGSFLSQAYRNETLFRQTLRADYALSPARAVYIEVEANQQDFRTRAGSLYDRDSNGFQIQAGIDFDLSRLARGNFQIGNLFQDYADRNLRNTSSFGLSGRIEYFPTQLTTLTFAASRQVQDTGLVETPTYVASDVSVRVDHELSRNIILTGRAGYGHDDYTGLQRQDDRYSVALGAVYLINRNWGVNARFERLSQESNGAQRGPRYDDDRLLVALVLQR